MDIIKILFLHNETTFLQQESNNITLYTQDNYNFLRVKLLL